MKKFFSTVLAVVAAMAINADNYYIGGVNNSWPTPGSDAAYQLTGEGDVLTASFERLATTDGLKVFVGEGWGNIEYGKPSDDAILIPNGDAVVLAQVTSGGNIGVLLAEGHYLANATVSFNPTTLELAVAGTDVDGSAEPDTYQIVGGFQDWKADAGLAVEFELVEGVLTANVADLNGSFKIIKNHGWAAQWATNWDTKTGLPFNEPYTLGAVIPATETEGKKEPDNLALANPFGGYRNAVLTLDMTDANAPVLTLVSGEFYVTENNWYFPGGYQGWKCENSALFVADDKKENTFELDLAELEGEFKVSYGNWAVEFGAQAAGDVVAPNAPYEMKYGKDNLKVEEKLIDVAVIIEVDYNNVSVKLTLGVEATALEKIAASKNAVKVVENGQLVVIKNGVRYTALGARL